VAWRFARGGVVGALLACSGAIGLVACGGTIDPGATGDAGRSTTDASVHDGSVGLLDTGSPTTTLPADASVDAADGSLDGGVDASEGDTAVPCNGGQCPSPAAVPGFQPTWIPPTGSHQNLCTSAMITSYYEACIPTSGPGTCADFGPDAGAANSACAACLASQYTDPAWGPLIFNMDGIVESNTAGCLFLLDPSTQACAESVESVDECEHAACDPVCNAASDPDFDQWVTCASAANTCSCAPSFQAAMCTKMLAVPSSPASPCLIGKDFEDFYYVVAPLFCGN
jgi:hypothetical protein